MNLQRQAPATSSITRVRIPDDDREEWVRTLALGGFTKREIRIMLLNLSDSYLFENHGAVIAEHIRDAEATVLRQKGSELCEHEKQHIHTHVVEKLRQLFIENELSGAEWLGA